MRWGCKHHQPFWSSAQRAWWRTWPWRRWAAWGVCPCREPWSNRPGWHQSRGRGRPPSTPCGCSRERESRFCRCWQWGSGRDCSWSGSISCRACQSTRDDYKIRKENVLMMEEKYGVGNCVFFYYLSKRVRWWWRPPALPRPAGCFLCLLIRPWPIWTWPRSFLVFLREVVYKERRKINKTKKK